MAPGGGGRLSVVMFSFKLVKPAFFSPPFRYLFEYIEEDDKRAWMILRN